MKKIIALASTALLMLGTLGTAAFAADASADVHVTISDDKGAIVLAQEKITVSDADSDGALTVSDALYAAHEAKYEGGADAGFASSMGAYGIQLDKLWGVANGGSYGYYINNASGMSLSDPIKNGDYVNAFVYTDLTTWSDTYCCFDTYTKTASEGEELTLTLSSAGYDASYNPAVLPVEGATITVDGAATEYKTDADGKVTVSLDAGDHMISATSETQTLVPPVCLVSVEAKAPVTEAPATEAPVTTAPETETEEAVTAPTTGDASVMMLAVLGAASLACLAAISAKRRNVNER